MHHAILLSVLLLSAGALADELTPPPVMPTEAAEPAIPGQFLELALKVDGKNRVTEGRAQTPVTHQELFRRLGRADLLSQSDALATRRRWLIISSVSLAVVAGIVGSVLIATAPVLASPACESDVHVYNDLCVPRAAAHNTAGTSVIAGGVAGALLLATLAYWSNPDVTDADQTAALVSTFNAQLARRLRGTPSGFKLLPLVTPDGATLTASLRF